MKIGKVTSASISNEALSLGSAVAGGAVSGGLMTLVPAEHKLVARGGMSVVGLLGASVIKGKGTIDTLAKFALLGLGIQQAGELVKHFASQSISIDETSTASQKFLGGMVGLACPCDDYPALASPVVSFPPVASRSAIPQSTSTPADEVAGVF